MRSGAIKSDRPGSATSEMVVPSARWSGESSAAVRQRFVERLGDAFDYEVVCVDDLPVAPSGKFQTIVPLEEFASSSTLPAPESGTQAPGVAVDFG